MSITVRHPGIQTTVQDLGRAGFQHLGVPVGGAMDSCAHRIANLLVGNDAQAAALECTLGGVALQFDAPTVLALTGRDITASLDGKPIAPWRPFLARTGELLVLHTGCRTSIAVAGGIEVPVLLGGRGTSLRAAFGGWQGRSLRREDRLPTGSPSARSVRIAQSLEARPSRVASWRASPALLPSYSGTPVVRVIAGPELAALNEASRTHFLSETFRIAPDSDRMGFRLTGPALALASPREMLSSGVTAGTIQLPPGGAPILLMADRQTTGGYPRLGDVIAVDLPLVAQLRPGDHIRFTLVALDQAHRWYRQREHDLACAERALHLRFGAGPDAPS